jgi:hypothetical protein
MEPRLLNVLIFTVENRALRPDIPCSTEPWAPWEDSGGRSEFPVGGLQAALATAAV